MTSQKIGRLLVRRGLRSDLPTDLLDGQLAFAVDTGELFVGAPQAPNPGVSGNRIDGNIRWITEVDPFAQPNTFISINLDPGSNNVLLFPATDDFMVFDYGLAYRDSGAYFAGSLKIYGTAINSVPYSDSSVTFTVQKVGETRTLTASNNSGTREINLTYQFRSWNDGLIQVTNQPIAAVIGGNLKRISAAAFVYELFPAALAADLSAISSSVALVQQLHAVISAALKPASASPPISVLQQTHGALSAQLSALTASISAAPASHNWVDVDIPESTSPFVQINAMASGATIMVGQATTLVDGDPGPQIGCYWDHDGAATTLPGTTIASAVTADGNIIAGVYQAGGVGDVVPFVYNRTTTAMTYLTIPSGCHNCEIHGISDDGTKLVGCVYSSSGLVAAMWHASTVTELDLSVVTDTIYNSSALAMSGDGTTAVGYIQANGGSPNISQSDRPISWNLTTNTATNIGSTTDDGAQATAVSHDGSIIAGTSYNSIDPHVTYRAFKWTSSTGSVDLRVADPDYDTYAEGMSADGSVIVGYASDGIGRHAARWVPSVDSLTLVFGTSSTDSDFYGTDPTGTYCFGYENDVAAFYGF
jgi:hypothetical protein